jgi:hypothetical protein
MAVSLSNPPRWAFRAGSILLSVATVIAALLSLMALLTPISLSNTIKNSHKILWSFQEANREIDAYRRRTGELPDSMELSRWKYAAAPGAYQVSIIDPDLNDLTKCCIEAVNALGMAPKQSYLLEVWRGEWSEYYAPWLGKSTLLFDPNEYAATGNLYSDIALSLILTAGLAYGARRMWRASLRSESAT